MSPGRIWMTVSPRAWTRPSPSVTCSVWEMLWECQAVRAPAVKRTLPSESWWSPCPAVIGVIVTSPVNQSAGPGMASGCGCTCMCAFSSLVVSGTQQRLDGAALVHRSVALGGVVERQGEVEDLPGVDLVVADELDELRQEPSYGCRSTVQVHAGEEQLVAGQ